MTWNDSSKVVKGCLSKSRKPEYIHNITPIFKLFHRHFAKSLPLTSSSVGRASREATAWLGRSPYEMQWEFTQREVPTIPALENSNILSLYTVEYVWACSLPFFSDIPVVYSLYQYNDHLINSFKYVSMTLSHCMMLCCVRIYHISSVLCFPLLFCNGFVTILPQCCSSSKSNRM